MKPSVRAALVGLLLWGLITPAWSVRAASDADDRRARIGLRMFRTALAADMDLQAKVSGGKLRLMIVNWDEPARAEGFATELKQAGQGEGSGQIRDWPYTVDVTRDIADATRTGPKPAGIYIVQDLPPEALKAVIDYGVREHVIVYSAIEGHVEKGVLGGLDVGVRVLPYINTTTLRASSVHLKELFLKVAKTYE